MTYQEIVDWFDNKEYDYDDLKFENIPKEQQLHPSSQLCGLLKVASFAKNPSKFHIEGDHEILYVCPLSSLELDAITESDLLYLYRCGVFYNEDCSGFAVNT